jgi:hypothetical protein
VKLYRVRISTLLTIVAFIALALGCGLLASRLSDAKSRNAALLANLQTARSSIVRAEFQLQAAEELHERFVDALTRRGIATPRTNQGHRGIDYYLSKCVSEESCQNRCEY